MQDYETAETLLSAIPAEFSDGTAVRLPPGCREISYQAVPTE